ncbi:hypothetical protein [uncultured Tenacibaculum sp.]|uniref:hypothetical protein n=1 Tax=uncultured Tenacibaculum sp. TaxID=174713 RepID=UPI002603D154|nr:hypothetical protein [uncultured Tenacibaculum sp.]
MKKIYLLFFFIIISCKERPTYNPFDSQYSLNKYILLEDGMDTVIDGCGYYSLQFTNKKFTPNYHFNFDEGDKVLAKGFEYNIDTIFSKTENIDSIRNLDFSLEKLNIILKQYQKWVTKTDEGLKIFPEDSSRIEQIDKFVSWKNDSTFVRTIGYYSRLK